MKKILILFIILTASIFVKDRIININTINWGSDSLDCRKMSLFIQSETKEFPRRHQFLEQSQMVCPQYKPNLYLNGIYLYKQIAKQKKKEKSADLKLYMILYMVFMMYGE